MSSKYLIAVELELCATINMGAPMGLIMADLASDPMCKHGVRQVIAYVDHTRYVRDIHGVTVTYSVYQPDRIIVEEYRLLPELGCDK